MHACIDDGARYGMGLERSGSMIRRDGITVGGECCGCSAVVRMVCYGMVWYGVVLCLPLCVRTHDADAAGGEVGDRIKWVSRGIV